MTPREKTKATLAAKKKELDRADWQKHVEANKYDGIAHLWFGDAYPLKHLKPTGPLVCRVTEYVGRRLVRRVLAGGQVLDTRKRLVLYDHSFEVPIQEIAERLSMPMSRVARIIKDAGTPDAQTARELAAMGARQHVTNQRRTT